MSRLRVFDQSDGTHATLDTADHAAIARALREVGVRFERWQAARVLDDAAEPTAVLEAYRSDIDRLKAEGGYRSVDVVRVRPDHPD